MKYKQRFRWKVAQALEIRWWQHYLKDKPKEDYLHSKKAYWQRVLAQTEVVLAQEMHILDAGCGPAGIFMVLEGHQVVALDPLLPQYEERLPHFRRNQYPEVQFYATRLEDFNAQGKYDIVFCWNVINHVDDIDRSLEQLIRAAKPGGILILSVDAHNYSVFKTLFQFLPGDILHPHQYDIKEYCQLLEQKNCSIQSVKKLKHNFFFDYYMIKVLVP